MRSRNLKPGFFKNDLLAECDPLARLLFTGLWCLADKEGRMEYRPKKIKAELLPYDDCNIVELLKQLQMKGFIVLYQHDGMDYLEVPTFLNHQNPHVNEANSTIPAPDKNSTSIELIGLIPSSLIPSSLIPDIPLLQSAPKRVRGSDYHEEFKTFWEAYPKKRGKGNAEAIFRKLKPSKELLAMMITAIEEQKKNRLQAEGFYPEWKDPERWLKAKGWEDEIDRNQNGGNNGQTDTTEKQRDIRGNSPASRFKPRPGHPDYYK